MSADLKESSVPLAEISQAPNAFEAFLDRNVKGLIALSVVLCIGAAGLVIYRVIEDGKQKAAGHAFVKAKDLAGYQSVVDSEKNTQAAGSAMVLLANNQWTAGKKEEAIGTLRKFISENPEHPALPTAKANLGTKLMSEGKAGDATKLLEEVVADPAARYIAPLALISLGDMAKAAGDIEKAEATYNKVKAQFPTSDFIDDANRRIAVLKAKAPVEIEGPPAPPTPPAGTSLVPGGLPPGLSITPSGEAPVGDVPVAPVPADVVPAPTPEESQPAPDMPEP